MSERFEEKDSLEVALYLKENGVNDSICDVFEDNEIDGQAFLDLSVEELNRLIPNKLGVVKKIYRLIQSICHSPPATKEQLLQPAPVPTPMCENDNSSHQSTRSASSTDPFELFALPDSWRPSIMYAINGKEESEQRKRLTPDVRNAIVRDLATTMFAFVNKPNKEFCSKVAKKLVLKYSFMKDVGIGVSGYGSWEKKLIERVHNVGKGGKREASGSSLPTPKRGRPKLTNSLLHRYPPASSVEPCNEEEEQALAKELEKDRPKKDVVMQLMKRTFGARRQYILTQAASESVATVLNSYKGFSLVYVLEQELDIILKKRDAMKIAGDDWTDKWAPAIIGYAKTLKGKSGKVCMDVLEDMFNGDKEEDEKKAFSLLIAFLIKGEVKDNLMRFFTEHQIGEDLDSVAKNVPSLSPTLVCMKDIEDTATYYIVIEKKVVVSGISAFTKALNVWFATHYIFNLEYEKAIFEVPLFIQEFVYGLPDTSTKKTSTYLSVTSSIQSFAAA